MFDLERKIFKDFKILIDSSANVLDEFLAACRAVNLRYDTKIYENRFIVGGVVEQLLGASMRAVGLEVDNIAKSSRGVDLLFPSLEVGLSVKAQFKRGSEIRLVNTMGGSGASVVWNHATVFVIVGIGIGYADPEVLSEGLSARSDALTLRISALQELWELNPEYLIKCDVPSKAQNSDLSRVASDVIAQDIMIEFKSLLRHFRPER
jgi:hypothetical protein